MSVRPPSGCWSCGTVPSREHVEVRGVIHPRTAAEGGPFATLSCPRCRIETVVVGVPGGDPVLAPLEVVGRGPGAPEVLLGGRDARELHRRAVLWVGRWREAVESLRRDLRRSPAPPRPKEGPRTRPRPESASGPPPPPPRASPPGAPQNDLPRTKDEARAILGLDPRAARREIDAAFRKASRKCHPDLVAHLDEEFQALAHRKFLRLKRAQEILTG